jgi:signal transduction histidine kinase
MSSTLLDTLKKEDGSEDDAVDGMEPEEREDMTDALTAIHRRSQGLMNFVSAYRNMTLIPKPKFRLLLVKDFFKRIEKMMSRKLTENSIRFEWSVEPKTLELTADQDLMEQVMINLLLNAISAVSGCGNPHIKLTAMMGATGNVIITVEDNGVGIVKEAQEKIFIPFYTTKKQGSGIGLSLSRQILRLHRAVIRVQSEPDNGTTFTLRFT